MNKKTKRIKYSTRRKWNAFTFTIPWIIGFIMFFAVPLFNTVIYSFSNVTVGDAGGMKLSYTGIANYVNLFGSEVTSNHETLLRLFTDENVRIVTNTPIIVIFSLFLALLANLKFKGRGVVRVIFFLPIILGLDIVVHLVAINTGGDLTAAGSSLFSEGLAYRLLRRYTEMDRSTINTITGYVDEIFTLISQAGVQTLIFLAGLQSISPSVYEVAKIEGANSYAVFWKVTLPMLSNITLFVAIYTMIDLFLESPLASEIYRFAFAKSKIGIGSALSVVYMLNVLVALMIVGGILGSVIKKYER